MIRSFLSFRRRLDWRRRAVFLVLFALQGAIAVSPLLEARDDHWIGVHVENRGARHAYMHNEDTCAVCAVRSLHSTVPVAACPPIVAVCHETVAAMRLGEAPDRPDVSILRSRAPPSAT